MIECIILDTDKIIDGDTGKQLSHSDQMIDVMDTERDLLHHRYACLQENINVLTDIQNEISLELQKYDMPSVGDIRRNGEIAPCPDTDELRKMTSCENRDEDNYYSCRGCIL